MASFYTSRCGVFSSLSPFGLLVTPPMLHYLPLDSTSGNKGGCVGTVQGDISSSSHLSDLCREYCTYVAGAAELQSLVADLVPPSVRVSKVTCSSSCIVAAAPKLASFRNVMRRCDGKDDLCGCDGELSARWHCAWC